MNRFGSFGHLMGTATVLLALAGRGLAAPGDITTVAGNGTAGFSGDGGAATATQLNYPTGVAVDDVGNIFIAEYSNNRIRKVDVAGTITTVAGDGSEGFSGDGGAAIAAQLRFPSGVAVDGVGNLLIAEWGNSRIRKVDAAGIITTVAGNGWSTFFGDGGPATAARVIPYGVAVDGVGNLLIADKQNNRIRKVDTGGTITTVVGNGLKGSGGDGGPATAAQLCYPAGVAVDGAGNLLIADEGNSRIRKVDAAGIITTVAGYGICESGSGFTGDGGPATAAQLFFPTGVVVDGADNIFIADHHNHRVRKVDTAAIITTVAGSGTPGFSGDGGAATAAQLIYPSGVAVDGAGNLLIADSLNNRIRKVEGVAMPVFSATATVTATPTPSRTPVITAGLAAYYPFNGNANDESGNGNHGAVNGATLVNDRYGNATSAYAFDGIDDYIAFPDSVFGPGTPEFTFAAWIETGASDYTALREIVYKGSVNGEAALAARNNRLEFSVKLGNGGWYQVNAPLIVNSRIHVVGIYRKGQTIEIWIDGQLGGTTSIPNSELFIEQYHVSSIGAYTRRSSFWVGLIDDVRIYNRALSGTEVQELYDDNPQATWSLSGFVYDARTNASVPGATVLLGPYSTTSDGNGEYSFSGLSSTTYALRVSKIGYADYAVQINPAAPSTRNVYLYPQAQGCSPGTLSGYIRDARTQAALVGVTVSSGNGSSTVTDSSGHYAFAGLNPASYQVSVSVADYFPYSQAAVVCGDTVCDIGLTTNRSVFGGQAPSGYGPDPVNTATGNYIYQHTDLQIPGMGIPFVFERNYNSQDATDGPLGFGWDHNFNTSLTVNPDETVVVRWGDGHTETFTPDGLGGFTPQYGVFDALTQNGDDTYTLTKKDLTQYRFNASNQLDSIVDKNGNTIALTYTGTLLTQITDTAGRVITLGYDGSNHLTLLSDPIGRTVQFGYDGNGDLVSATDPNGHTTTYTYDADHQLVSVTDPRGNVVVTNTYDTEKRVVTSQRDAKGGQTTYSYDPENNVTTITDALGGITKHHHDELLRLIREDDANGNSAFYVYDAAGNRTSVTDKNGNPTTYEYDSRGNVTKKTATLDSLTQLVTTITYDTNNNPLTRTDALGQTTSFAYDTHGNLISTTDPLGHVTAVTYDAAGLPLTVTDPRGNTTANSYDAQGNLSRVTDALGNHSDYTCDAVGHRLTATNARGQVTAFAYDAGNNLLSTTDARGGVTTYTFDENNNRTSVTDPRGNSTTFTYDQKDLLATAADALSNSETNTYDALDRKIAVQDRNGNTMHFAYDGVGRLTGTQDALGNTTAATYDGNGNRLTVHDPLGNVTTTTYDALNRATRVSDPLSHASATAYDALGRVIATANAKLQNTEFTYDALGRLLQVTDAAGGTVVYTYDENGNRLSMTDPNGHTTTYSYDALNRLTTMVEPLGNTTTYEYDAAGNVIRKTDPNGNPIHYSYDELNRLTTITYTDASAVTFTYDVNGNRTQMVDGLGITTYIYDALNRMTQYTDSFGQSVGYGYDAVGNRTSLTYPGGNVVTYAYDAANRLAGVTDWLSRTTTYAYDAASRLVLTTNPNGTTATYGYDAAGRLLALTNARLDASIISSYAYTLDELGNHLQVDQNEPLAPEFTSRQTGYSYDAENRLVTAGTSAVSFDDNGNTIAMGADTFAYDFEDRLTRSSIGGIASQYQYDGAGRRLTKTLGSTTRRYILDVNRSLTNVLAETYGSGNVGAYYLYGHGLVARIVPDGAAQYYHYDSGGSTIALTDSASTSTDQYAYESFGQVANRTGATQNPFTYVGRYGVVDEGNGLQFMRARYYDSKRGRFMTKDPVAPQERASQTLSRYAYVVNNPIHNVDPSGRFLVAAVAVVSIVAIVAPSIILIVEDLIDRSNQTADATHSIKEPDSTSGSELSAPDPEDEIAQLAKVLAQEKLRNDPSYLSATTVGGFRGAAQLEEYHAVKEGDREAREIFEREGIEGVRREIAKLSGHPPANSNLPTIPEAAEVMPASPAMKK